MKQSKRRCNLRITSLKDLKGENPTESTPIIHGLARAGEVVNLIAPPKIGKSWIAYDLATSVASGRPWLGREVQQGKVLIFDYELQKGTIVKRLTNIQSKKNLHDSLDDAICPTSLRGKALTIKEIEMVTMDMKPGDYAVVIIDPLYRAIGEADENSNSDMARIYNVAQSIAERLQCVLVLVHHAAKGSQSSKGVTDVGSGAGSQSRAADTHIVLRPHTSVGVYVMDAAVRSFPPVKPVCVRWEMPLFSVTDDDPSLLLRSGGKRTLKAEAVPVAPEWTVTDFVSQFLSADPQTKASIQAACKSSGISDRNSDRLIKMAVEQGLAYRWEKPLQFATRPKLSIAA